jgi:hypothetical protein
VFEIQTPKAAIPFASSSPEGFAPDCLNVPDRDEPAFDVAGLEPRTLAELTFAELDARTLDI